MITIVEELQIMCLGGLEMSRCVHLYLQMRITVVCRLFQWD